MHNKVAIIEDAVNFTRAMQEVVSSCAGFRIGPLEISCSYFALQSELPFKTREHDHPYYELSTSLNSSLEYIIGGNKRLFSGDKRQMVLIPPLVLHIRSSKTPNVNLVIHLAIKNTESSSAKIAGKLHLLLSQMGYRLRQSSDFDATLASLLELTDAQPDYWLTQCAFLVNKFILEFFMANFPKLLENCETPVSSGKYHMVVGKLLYNIRILTNLPPSATLHAKALGISTRHLSRIVKNEYGISLYKLIVKKRMEMASEMLSEKDCASIKNIASNLGFADTAHFCRMFKQEMGMTPLEYHRKGGYSGR